MQTKLADFVTKFPGPLFPQIFGQILSEKYIATQNGYKRQIIKFGLKLANSMTQRSDNRRSSYQRNWDRASFSVIIMPVIIGSKMTENLKKIVWQ